MSIPADPTPEQGATPPPPPAGAVPPPAYQAPPAGYQAPPAGYQAPPPGYAAPPPGYAAAAPMSDSDQRMWAMLAHISGILFWFVGPLVIWLIQKDKSRFVEEQAKEALNWQITLAIGWVIGFILTAILIGIFVLLAVGDRKSVV